MPLWKAITFLFLFKREVFSSTHSQKHQFFLEIKKSQYQIIVKFYEWASAIDANDGP